MKRIVILIAITLVCSILANAQVTKILAVTAPGSLITDLTSDELITVTNLTLTGAIDARDFKTMRDEMTVLAELDLSGTTIVAYSGTDGPYNGNYYDYQSNSVPPFAYYNQSTGIGKTSLTTILFPLSITTIGMEAFSHCTGMSSLNISGSVISIEYGAFAESNGFITVADSNPNYSSLDGVLFDKTQNLLIHCPTSKSGDYIIPSTVQSIGNDAFSHCNNLISVTIPSTVSSIAYGATGISAFYRCSASIIVDLSNPYYSGLDGILFNKSKTTLIQCSTFRSGSYIIPSSVTSIWASSFLDCAALTSVTIPSSVTFIGIYSFCGCSGLTSLSLPFSVNEIGNSAFAGCTGLMSIFAKEVTPPNLGGEVFYNVNKSSCQLHVPFGSLGLYQPVNQWQDFTTMVEMPGYTLSANTANIAAPEASTAAVELTSNVAWSALSDKDWLSVDPASGVEPGSGTTTQTLTLTANVNTSVAPRTAVVTLSSPGIDSQMVTVTQAGSGAPLNIVAAGGLFSALTSDELLTVTKLTLTGTIDARDFKTMRDEMPVLAEIDLSGATIVAYSGTEGTYQNGITTDYLINSIPQYAFSSPGYNGKTSLMSITLPLSITSIGLAAFSVCTGLTAIILPSGVSSIGNGAFYNCSGLISVTISPSVNSIGNEAFWGCSGLTVLSIPSSVFFIGSQAFSGCSGLTIINAIGSVPVNLSASLDVFGAVNKTNCILHVPYGANITYSGAAQWQDFLNISGASDGFSLSSTKVNLTAEDHLSANVIITANVVWTATSEQLWLTAVPSSETGNQTLTLTAQPNPLISPRSANVTISSPGLASETITITQAGMPKTADVTAGGLAAMLTDGERATITKLILTGTIDARDFKTMRDEMPLLAEIDLSSATIAEYIGPDGTYPWDSSYDYPANTLPDFAFFDPSKGIGKVSLRSLLLPSTATSIGNQSLQGCTGLSSITIPSSVVSIGSNTFSSCSGLTSVNLPSSLTSIGDWAFSGCVGIASITIPSSVTTFGSYAFIDCTGLTSVVLPSSITSIGVGTFQGCSSLTSVNIPSSVTSVGQNSFLACSSLTSITIPISVTSIGTQAFYACSGLTTINAQSVTPIDLSSSGSVFGGVSPSTCALHVSYGSAALYAAAPQWKDFTNVVEDPGFRLSSSSVNFAAAGGSADPISISANVIWSAGSDQAWLTPEPASFTNDHALTLTAEANSTVATRTARVTISSTGVVSQMITVTQAGMPKTVDATAGGLAGMLSDGELATITKLILTGTIDARDFKTMRDDMPLLTEIDLSGATIAAFSGDGGTYPWGWREYPANTVPDYSFYNGTEGKNGLTSILLPSSTTSIGNVAFQSCSGLTSIILPSLVSLIGNQSFNACTGLTSVILPSAVTSIGGYAFSGCSGLASIILSSSLISIGEWAFSACTGLTSITIPPLITTIANYAFSDCSKLTSISIPPLVTAIGDGAFQNCTGLTSVNIPLSVVSIGSGAFTSCSALSTIEIPSSVNSIGSYAFNTCSSLTSVVIPSSVTSIADGTFYNCWSLNTIEIPSSVTSIGGYSFNYCSGLTSVTIPISVTTIGQQAFNSCSGLTSIYSQTVSPVSLNSSPNVFGGVGTTTCALHVSYGTTLLYSEADQWKDFLTVVEDPGFRLLTLSVNFLAAGGSADPISVSANVAWSATSDQGWLTPDPLSFTNDHTLTLTAEANPTVATRTARVTISSTGVVSQMITVTQAGMPKTVDATAGGLAGMLSDGELATITKLILTGTIDARDFKTMRDDMPLLAEIDMSGAAIASYSGPDGTYPFTADYPADAVPDFSFYNVWTNSSKTGLISILFPSTVKAIGNQSLQGCAGLSAITIPSSVVSIGNNAFANCSKLNSVDLSSSLTSIGSAAFQNCNSLISISIPPSVLSIEDHLFYNCYGLTTVNIPSTVTSIGDWAFYGCSGLTSLIIPSSVANIGYAAFYDCSGLTTFTIPSSVTSVNNETFRNCSALTSVTIPSSITSIGANAFINCNSLTSVTIPISVNSIGYQAFYGCSALASIYAQSVTPVDLTSSWNVFLGVNTSTCTLHISYGSAALYVAALQWQDFTNVVEDPGFRFSTFAVSLPATGGSADPIAISANVTWSAGSGQAWLTPDPASFSNDHALTLTAEANPTVATRTARVTISSPGVVSQTIIVTQAGMPKTADVTAGSLAGTLTHDELQTITKLILKGTIDARDFKTMRDDMPLLAEIDMSGATIAEYIGPDGTYPWASSYDYSANTVPDFAFFNPSTNVGKASLTSILLPATATSLGNQSLQACTGLSSITLPPSVVSIGRNAFSDCNGLTSISLPPSLTSIGGWAFSSCTGLTSLSIPSSVNSIGTYAFSNCTGLTTINIPSSVTSLSDGTFESCTGLTSINIPSSVTSIGSNAFYYCSGLTSVTIPISVTTIGSQAFYSCSNLSMIYAKSISPVNLNSSYNVFYGVAISTCALHVSYGSAALYAAAPQWQDFTNVVEDQGFRLSTSTVSLPATAGSADPIAISANVTWSAGSDQAWLTPDPTSFTNDHSLTLTAEANPTVATRTASVTISSPGVVSQTITITQAGMPKTVVVTAGGLAAMLTDGERATITKLILTGTIDARDFKTMRDDMPLLAEIDMSGATIATYEGSDGTNPWGYENYPENSVPDCSFYNLNTGISKSTLTSLLLPSTAISIGNRSLQGCTGLSSITIPTSVVSIGSSAFSLCSGMISINLSSSLNSIGDWAFSDCTGLTSLPIPTSVTSIGNYAFNNCTVLTTVSIPSSVAAIGDGTFQNCTALISVTIPSSVISIGNNAFNSCIGLTSFSIPSSVTIIGYNSFIYCSNLASVIIPISVTSIGEQVFYGCSGLTSIYSQTVAPVILNASPSVFYDVNKSTCILHVSYGSKVLYSEADQWKDFINVVEDPGFRLSRLSVNFAAAGGSADPISVSSNVIWSATSDQGWLVPSPVSATNDHSLTLTAEANTSVATRIAKVTIASPDVVSQVITVTQIGVPKILEATAGSLGTTLTADELNTITRLILTGTIDARDFKTMRDNMPLLAEVDLSDANIVDYGGSEGTNPWGWSFYPANNVPDYSFYEPSSNIAKTSLTSILLPLSTISIGNEAFQSCSGLTSIILPSLVNSISSQAFYGCFGLTSVTLPSSVTSIGNYAFSGCTGLATINLPSLLTSIGDWAFSGCTALTAITIPPSVTTIANYAFAECSKLISISIPPLVTAIGEGIFQNCTGLTTVNIPSTVVSIGYGAFNNCQSLSSISIPSSVKSIGAYGFSNCTSLGSIVIPLSVTSIAEGTFQSCHGLTSFTIPGSVSSIGSQAFYDCTGLTSIFADRSIPVDLTSSPDVFGNVDKGNCVLNVPFGTHDAYKSAVQWSDFLNTSAATNGFSLSSAIASLAAAAGSSDVTVTANVAWSVVSSDPSWLTVSPLSGSNNGALTISATENTGLSRMATVTVSSTGIGDQTILVTQATGLIPLILSVNRDNTAPIVDQALNLVISNNSLTGYFRFMPTVSSTYTFSSSSVSNPYGVLYDNPGNYLASGDNENGLNFNFSYALNAGQVYYLGVWNYNGDNLDVAIQITGGGLQSLWLSSNSVSLAAPEGSNAIVDVTDRNSWSATSDQPWLTLTPESGLSSGPLRLTATENTGSTRTATVTLSSSGSLNQVIAVTQLRSDAPINIAAGTLSTVLSAMDRATITKLTLTGNIDARDFKTMRDDMPILTEIDLSGANVVAYSGSDGTTRWGNTNYLADEIPEAALQGKTILTKLNLPTNILVIRYAALASCNFTTINIPNSVTNIGGYSFQNCRGLNSIFIPSTVNYIGEGAFTYFVGSIEVDANNPNYTSQDGVLYDKVKGLILQCPISKIGTFTIPSSVYTIGLTTFAGCDQLTNVIIPVSVKTIESGAFKSCSSLTTLTIPSSVTSIKNGALIYCSGLNSIYSSASIPVNLSSEPNVFNGVNTTSCKLYVPYGAAALYRVANQWQDFTNIVEATEGFSLGSNAVTLASGAGSNSAVSVTANVDWAVTSDQLWLIPSPLSGSNDGSITLTAEANSGFDRTATVTVSSPGFSNQTIVVTQSSGIIPLTLSDNMNNGTPIFDQASMLVTSYIDKMGYFRFMPTVSGNYTFSSVSNSDPQGVIYDNYGHFLIGRHQYESNFNFSFALTAGQVYYFGVYNPNGGGRNIVVTVTGGGLQSLWLSSNSVSLAAPEGSNTTVDVTDRNSWSATSDQLWLTVTPESGLSSGPLKLTAAENTGSTRIATVTVKSSGSIDQVITVTQVRSDTPINITAGTLSTVLSVIDLASLTKLTLTGNIDARDFKTMRDDMPLLAEIDLSGATVVAYSGTEGTYPDNLNYPAGEIPFYAFYNSNTGVSKTNLISFKFPSTVTLIGSSSFSNCTGLVSVNLPSFVSSIGDNAFSSCNGLASVVIPVSVTSIGSTAFDQCPGLTSMFVPSSVTSIGTSAFRGIQCLISVDPANPYYSVLDGVLFDKAQTLLIQYPGSKSGGYLIPHTVVTIGRGAFMWCNNLNSVEIPASVKVIEVDAFWNCNGLTTITIPSTVTSIKSEAFGACYGVTTITAGWSIPLDLSASANVFNNMDKASILLHVPYGSAALYRAATQWKDFTTIVEATDGFNLSASAVRIAAATGSQTTIDINANVAWSVSSDQSWLTVSPASESGNKTLTFTAEANSSIQTRVAIVTVSAIGCDSQIVTVTQACTPANITAGNLSAVLGTEVLSTMTSLTITGTIDARDFKTMRDIMPLLTEIDLSGATVVAYSGTEGTYPNNYTYPANEIPRNAFWNQNTGNSKTNLISFEFPSTVTSIGRLAFNSCIGLVLVNLPSLVSSIGDQAFSSCNGLTSIFIPESVTSIGSYTFQSCRSLTSIFIPSSVTSIGNSAFSGIQCLISVDPANPNYSSLDGVLFDKAQTLLIQYPGSKSGDYSIPPTVITIGQGAFWACGNLSSVEIPSSVKVIGAQAFWNCYRLISLTIPSTVTSIQAMAFEYCYDLTSITAGWSVPLDISASNQVFDGINKDNCILHVPYRTASFYRSANQWQDFTNIVEASEGFSLGSYAVTLASGAGSSMAVSISANVPWTISSNQSWLVPTPASGSSDGSIMLTADANTGFDRSAKVTVSSPGQSDQVINVTQSTGLTPLTLSDNMDSNAPIVDQVATLVTSYTDKSGYFRFMPTVSGIYTFSSTSNSDPWAFLYDNSISFLTQGHNQSGSDFNFSYSLTAGQVYYLGIWNPNGANQNIVMNITGGGLQSLWLSTNNVSLDAPAGSNAIVDVTDRTSWSVSSDQAWLTASPASGISSGAMTLTASENTGSSRTATVTVSSPGSLDQVITVNQARPDAPINIEAGTLSTVLTATDLLSITKLNLTGTIDARDFKTMRDNMPLLTEIDLSGATVVAYSGSEGTYPDGHDYLANSIPDYAFLTTGWQAKTLLTSFVLPSSVTSIGSYAFTNSGLTGITITSTVVSIGGLAFYGCNGLISITIPSPVTYIGVQSFSNCQNLTSVTIAGTVTTIEFIAFLGSSGPITVDESNPNYSSLEGILFNKIQNLLIQCPKSKSGSYIIPASVSRLGRYAFGNCSGLNSLTIPSSVSSIESYVFMGCSALTSLYSNRAVPVNLISSTGVFAGIDKTTCILYVPYGSAALYRAASQWQDFTNIVEASEGFLLSSNSLSLGASEGNNADVNVSANVAWTVSSDQLWLTPSPISGSNDGVINLKASANIGFDRIAVVTVSSPGKSDQIITVTQASGVVPINLASDMSCNAPFVDQTATLLTSNQANGFFRFIPFETKTYTFSSSSSSDPSGALYNMAGIQLAANDDYNGGLNFNFSFNLTAGQPYYFGIFNYSGDNKQVIVNITGGGLQSLMVCPASVNLAGADGSNKTVELNAKTAWSSSSDQLWLTVTPGSGSGSGTITLTANENTGSFRSATVTFSSSGAIDQKITVNQARSEAPINITAGTLSTVLSSTDLSTITKLTLTGNIDARDFKTMRDNMPILAELDLSGATVVAYSGTLGTVFGGGSVDYPANEIPQDAFYNKQGLTTVIIPSSVNSIARAAFYFCSGLAGTFTIPSLVAQIGMNAFDGCTGLASVNIPASVTSIGNPSFADCSGLFNVDPGNLNYSSLDGVLFNQSKTVLMQCPSSKEGSYTVPSSVTTFANQAFIGCNKLTGSLIIPAFVTSIGDLVFTGCSGLTSIIIPASVISVGTLSFADCTGLTSIYTYNKIPVDLGSSSYVFNNVNKVLCTLYVPYGTSALFRAASQWQDFVNIVEMPGFALSAITADVAASLNSTAAVDVTSNTEWSASSDQPWLVATPNPGSGDHVLTFTAAANPVTSTRTAVVTVSATGVESQTITVTQAAGELSLKAQITVYLEGVYAGSGLMTTRLREKSLVPTKQPFTIAPWNYAGKEENATIPADVVDWVLVEIRQSGAPADAKTSTIMEGWPKACLLKSDGSIVEADGTSLPTIGNPEISANLYVVIRHRNHIAIMSSTGMTRIGDNYVHNFTDAVSKAYGGTSGYRQIVTGVCGMVSGDANSSGDITVLDFTKWATDFGKTDQYLNADINGDSQVSVLDFTKWATNFGQTGIAPVKSLNIVAGESQPAVSYKSQVPGN